MQREQDTRPTLSGYTLAKSSAICNLLQRHSHYFFGLFLGRQNMMPGWYRDHMEKSKILQHFGGENFKIVQIRNEPAGPLNICELFKVQRVIQAEHCWHFSTTCSLQKFAQTRTRCFFSAVSFPELFPVSNVVNSFHPLLLTIPNRVQKPGWCFVYHFLKDRP